ncbi:DUF397 domain-containing protein [Streptomyces albireticuli]|uniref:DUF397 domain-containing protein n=1 Tax=Streptomyces albireticuli TaxID=1940 RepID=A0A2A2DF23_9ACTN|nr:DUF397 domain-containing protein [Streptomyces albireticuli]
MAVPSSIAWQKSSYSGGGDNNNCVELGCSSTFVQLRESATPAVTLTVTPHRLSGLIRTVKAGLHDVRSTDDRYHLGR